MGVLCKYPVVPFTRYHLILFYLVECCGFRAEMAMLSRREEVSISDPSIPHLNSRGHGMAMLPSISKGSIWISANTGCE